MGQQSRSEGAVLRFAKYYTPVIVITCILIIVVPAAMQQPNLNVRWMFASAIVESCTFCAALMKEQSVHELGSFPKSVLVEHVDITTGSCSFSSTKTNSI